MLYDTLKIIHILSAGLVLFGMVSSIRHWVIVNDTNVSQINTQRLILPFALMQLLTGFTMISLKHHSLSELWIKGSLIGFIVAMVCWFAFLVTKKKSLQKIFLSSCMIAIGCMIFCMVTQS